MSHLIRTDRIWDLSQPIYHDGPAWRPSMTRRTSLTTTAAKPRDSTPRHSH